MLGYGQWRLLGHYASYLKITLRPFPDVRACYLECSLTCSSQPCEKKVSEISLTRLFDLMFLVAMVIKSPVYTVKENWYVRLSPGCTCRLVSYRSMLTGSFAVI